VNLRLTLLAAAATALSGLAVPGALPAERESSISQDPSRLQVIDCLLPGKIRRLGGRTYQTQRRPVKTSASDCGIRGGEYTAYDRANYQTALEVWLPQAESGDAQAQSYVGEIFEKGLGRPADYAQAARWYEKAAAQNYSRAQMNLAYLYEQGLGVAKDPLKALNLYRQASGITDDSLTYVSEVTALQKVIDDLTTQLEQQNSDIDRLRAEVESGQSQVMTQRSALERAQNEASSLRSEISRLRSQPVTDPTQLAALQQRENDLRARELKLLEDERTVTGLEATTAEQHARLVDQLKAAAEKDLALRQQLQQTAEDRDELQQQLDETQRRLLGTEQRVAKLGAELAAARARIALDRELLAKRPVASTPGDQAERRKMEADLSERDRKLTNQQAQISTLLDQKHADLAELTRLREEQRGRSTTQGQQQANLAAARQRLAQTEKTVADLTAQLEAERSRAAADRQQLAQRSSSATAAEQKQRQELQASLAARESKIAEQQRQIESLRAQQQTQAQQAADQQTQQRQEFDNVRLELASTQSRFAVTRQRVADLTVELAALRRSVATSRAELTRSAEVPQQQQTVRLRDELARREADLVRLQAQNTWLLSQSEFYQRRIQELQAKPAATGATPRGAGGLAQAQGLPASKVPKKLRGRSYYALIIGNDNYQQMPHLKTARGDAQAIDEVLQQRYGFKTKLLPDATEEEILQALIDYKNSLTSDDSLLIYYAGHGELSTKNKESYWLPIDAQPDTLHWISGDQISAQLNLIPARQIMVVADSCYQGIRTRETTVGFKPVEGEAAQLELLSLLVKMRSRTVLTSGGDRPVLDSGGGAHSIFAREFLRVLRENDRVLVGSALHYALKDEVRKAAAPLNLDQSPRYNSLVDAGDGNGEFLFIPVS
jgi:hypothetical protein